MTFYFYDLETSGFSPSAARIMQFAGQRTDENLRPVGEPHNILIRLSEDVVPDPDAILVTGITPQSVNRDGITEAEFLKLFAKEIVVSDTVFVGFNSIRFDDEFMRYLQYRNFYDPYEWQWKDGRGRWDLLDVVRMTRALRPDGIKWPVDAAGVPANRLTLLTAINGLDHANAHDALSDVQATIALAQLIQTKQPKLFGYLLNHRDKKAVSALVTAGEPFVYTSGKYPSEYEKTTVALSLGEHPSGQGVLVYDLRHDPAPYADLSPADLAAAWTRRHDEEGLHLPVKTLKFNRCPAVAPLSVLDQASQQRLQLDPAVLQTNRQRLSQLNTFVPRLTEALAIMDRKKQTQLMPDSQDPDSQLYDGFFSERDRTQLPKIRAAGPEALPDAGRTLQDARLKALLPLYKARNYPRSLTPEERQTWEAFCARKLLAGDQDSRLGRYFKRIEELRQQSGITTRQQHLLMDLELYGQSLLPAD